MRYFLTEDKKVIEESQLRMAFDENRDYEGDFQDYIEDCLHQCCTEVDLSPNIIKKIKVYGESEMGINLLYVDRRELQEVLDVLIKQELYKLNNIKQESGCSFQVAKEHVEAEIEKIHNTKQVIKSMLNAIKYSYDVKTNTARACDRLRTLDLDSTRIDQLDEYMIKYIENLTASIENLMSKIIPDFKPDHLLIEKWFYPDSEYIETLISWCDMRIEMD